jgi:putative transcriptional regulator
VVLRGGFSDADGDYQAGDFVVRTAGEVHRPAAWPHSDCLTLSVLDGPIYFQGWLARLANPFLKLRPR